MKKYVIQRMPVTVGIGSKMYESKPQYLASLGKDFFFTNGVNEADVFDSFEDAESVIYFFFRWVEPIRDTAQTGCQLTIVPIYIMD
jgi:hypothetical protein